jgi:type I restriction-modification system DNA methylase subunit
MTAPQVIIELVERFEQNKADYRAGKYNETQLRREFLDPFFKVLGWDVDNEKSYAEAYKDVIHEAAVKVGEATKAPDYAFRIGGTRKFFVEAKKPSVNIKDDIAPAFQVRRYAWSAKLPLSILSDFEEFAVYDCRVKPHKSDKASVARVMYFTYQDYLEKWDEIVSIFSRDAILKGSFDQYAISKKKKRGTAEVDEAFLEEIERWRDLLARNIALRNKNALSSRQLNEVVQLTIDRIVFLRIAEGRGVEVYGQLQEISEGEDIYARLGELFRKADARYNSGLFHFGDEKGISAAPDTLTLGLEIDDKVLKDILSNLYYPESPYVFSEIPSDILGQVYERFLGKVIRLTPSGQAKVEEKPEVRKAGGVYYTPTYIVDYIVENTVGKLLEGKTPVSAEKLKIVDPACGSGTFLLGAFQHLIDWHLKYYLTDNPSKWAKKKVIFEGREGWQLTLDEKRRILTNNLFGVDIDAQAVEVTKLSLLLKVIETPGQLDLLAERILPDLSENVKCGNSLIGSDYYDDKQMPLLPDNDFWRVNAFDWRKAFAEIFAQGGFDAVIGNPPYIRIQAMKEWAPDEVEFYKTKYISASKGNYDIYVVFVEKALKLLGQKGLLGFILPHKFFNAKYGAELRKILGEGKHLSQIVHFGDQQVFANATTYTCLLFLNQNEQKDFEFEKVSDLAEWQLAVTEQNPEFSKNSGFLSGTKATEDEWNFVVGEFAPLHEKLSRYPVFLADIADRVFQGLITGADAVFILEKTENGKVLSKQTNKEYQLEAELLHPLCKGSVNLRRYQVTDLEKMILFPYEMRKGKAELISVKTFKEQYPKTWEYLLENREVLEGRERGKWKHDKWYAFGRSQNLSEMEQSKLLTPSIAQRTSFTYDHKDYFYFVGSGGGGGGGYGVTLKANIKESYLYILGLLNSKLLDTFLKTLSTPFSGGYYAYNRQYIEQLPIRTINFADPAEVKLHDEMVALVERMLSLHEQTPQSPREKEMLQRQIEVTDAAIDRLVYQLYGLTEEEIKIVEG